MADDVTLITLKMHEDVAIKKSTINIHANRAGLSRLSSV
jgi:hypothetical protein